jgi:trans-aconitate 2-methyltransferase
VAVDGSPEMLALTRRRLADLGDRVRTEHSDLLALDIPERVDLVFSNAVFHWIADHDLLFARLAAVMAPGGRLEAQCGGRGNIAAAAAALEDVALRAPYAPFLGGFRRRWRFASAEATAARLARAGLVDVRTWLEPQPVRLPVGGPAERFMSACVLRLHLQRLPEELRAPFTAEVAGLVADEDGIAHLDYVRLNMSARRPGRGDGTVTLPAAPADDGGAWSPPASR